MTNRRKRRRTELARRQGWACHYCLRRMDRRPGDHDRPRGVTIDHVVPQWAGGEDETGNLVACCYACNQLKGGDYHVSGEGAA